MKTNKLLRAFGLLACLTTLSVYAAGGESGGGGDSLEERVNDIRADILKWINAGGSRSLKLPAEISHEDYANLMTGILQPQRVVIGFAESKISVGGVPKTCRSYISTENSRPHILCNIARFKGTAESDQYRLIHHEYAGLVRLERNDGAASDYEISSQLTDYLREQTVLRLAVLSRVDREAGSFNPMILLEEGKTRFEKIQEILQWNRTVSGQGMVLFDELIEKFNNYEFSNAKLQNAVRECGKSMIAFKADNLKQDNSGISAKFKRAEDHYKKIEIGARSYLQAEECLRCDPEVRKTTMEKYKKIILDTVERLDPKYYDRISYQSYEEWVVNKPICSLEKLFTFEDDKEAKYFIERSQERFYTSLSSQEVFNGSYDDAFMFIGKNAPVLVKRNGNALFGPKSQFNGKMVMIRFNYHNDPISGDWIGNTDQYPKVTNPIKIIQRDL